jgi:hypothetical protein
MLLRITKNIVRKVRRFSGDVDLDVDLYERREFRSGEAFVALARLGKVFVLEGVGSVALPRHAFRLYRLNLLFAKLWTRTPSVALVCRELRAIGLRRCSRRWVLRRRDSLLRMGVRLRSPGLRVGPCLN